MKTCLYLLLYVVIIPLLVSNSAQSKGGSRPADILTALKSQDAASVPSARPDTLPDTMIAKRKELSLPFGFVVGMSKSEALSQCERNGFDVKLVSGPKGGETITVAAKLKFGPSSVRSITARLFHNKLFDVYIETHSSHSQANQSSLLSKQIRFITHTYTGIITQDKSRELAHGTDIKNQDVFKMEFGTLRLTLKSIFNEPPGEYFSRSEFFDITMHEQWTTEQKAAGH
jgi:hypothetical protein